MSDLYIKINSPSLGDTIASTPTIRKLSKIYNKKINVITHVKEVFLNNEYVHNIYSFEELDRLNLKIHKNKLFETFLGCGVKNQYDVEKKHNTIDIRQFHALDLGFMLLSDEMFYDYTPFVFENIKNLPSDYVCLHVSETWESRTYKKENWQNLINKLNENNIPIVLIGKNSFETGFHTMQKNVFGLNLQNGLDLTNKLSLSQSWHVINKSKVFVTMDSGPMHLAGTTDAFIIQLGSSINNKLRAPYRNNSQDYKYKYISGPCGIFCASDMKYGIKEWGTIQGVPPLIKCLENKSSYECHPNVNQVIDFILNEIFFIDNKLFIKRENMKKIGLLLTAYNCENYINPCLDPWVKLKEKHNIKIATNSGMFSDYKALGFENRNQGTLDKLNQYKFDYFIKTDDQNLLDEDSSRNKCLNYLINEQHCDLIWILDADEIYKELEIENIINYVNKNDALYYSVNFKNYLFTKDYSSDYLPPRIFWTNKNSGIKKFHFDNHITYNDNSVSEVLPHHEIPKDVAYVDHYSWLAEDSRTKEKIIYQNKRFAGEENAKCAFVWDDNYDCLIFNENFYQKRNLQKSFNYEPPKYLFITAHLSTGGSPKYLEWLIKKTKKQNAKIKVIEWNLYSDAYVVQRNSIINMIGENNFYTVGNYYEDDILFNSKQQNVIDYIKDFNPDFIHLNEFSENFAIKPLSSEIINFLYNKERKHKLFETTHSANSDILNKKNIPDELWMVSKYQYDIAKETNIKTILVEMEVEKKTRPDREKTLKSLGLDPDKIHILQVGLFSINKNQKFTFEVANQFLNSNVQFHFVGNECYIDECGLDKNLNNCRIWGERSDVDLFMSCMDLFVMPSHEELNPIALKEAISWDMKCFISNLTTINNQYKNSENVVFIENDNFLQYIKDNLNEFDNNTVPAIYSLNDEPNRIICSFNPSPKVEILGNENVLYNIKFIDDATGIMHFESNINTNMWTQSSVKYYCKWRIIVTNLKLGIENIYDLDLKNQSVKIINDSNSLGDSICWMAAVDKFQKLHNCKIDYYTAKKDLFINEYPNIKFYNYGDVNSVNYCAQYTLGCFAEEKTDLFRKDWRLQSLQEIAFSILGLDYIESKTKITIKNKFKLNFNKYVCIATQSTSQSRYWNNDGGWIKTVAYLQKLGYKVVCVDKYPSFGTQDFMNTCPSNVNYFAGNHSFDEIIDIINGCEFFIGLSSGLSWLTWAIGKKIISINGSVGSNFEFYTPYRIINSNVCNGCFNNINYKFSSSDWKWCPTNKNFECSKTIKFEIVKEVVDDLIDNLKKL
jgi:autotransporter strand-loop-strand O-heptosyltransferase